jgi:pimeloyl-ACP methyl ester carboxylesterase
MHSDRGNSQEGLKFADQALEMGFDFCTFDFAGCGNSTGPWVTHSWREVGDLHAVLKFIYDYGQTMQVVIWGRGIGAVTALMYERTITPVPVVALVLDTVYADLKEVVKSIATNELKVDLQYLASIWPSLCTEIKGLTGGLDLGTIKTLAACKRKNIPALFVHAVDDARVPLEQAEICFEAYKCECKEITYCEGGHFDVRP